VLGTYDYVEDSIKTGLTGCLVLNRGLRFGISVYTNLYIIAVPD